MTPIVAAATTLRVLEAANVAVALTLAAHTEPDLVIIDARQGDGIVALPRARAAATDHAAVNSALTR